jgi:hypothetical protein
LATTSVSQSRAPKFPVRRPFNPRNERLFFAFMCLIILAAVFAGFARTYYLAGVFRAPLPNMLVHVHGAVFTLWIFTLITQVTLVAAGRTDLHKRFGLFGFALAVVMIIIGVWASTNALHRGLAPLGLSATTFYMIPLTDMLAFAVLIFAAYRTRFQPVAHKRLILIATIALLAAATVRWPLAIMHQKPFMMDVFVYLFLVPIILYDLWVMRRVHKATMWGSVFLIVLHQIRVPLAFTAPWQAFASWVQHYGH